MFFSKDECLSVKWPGAIGTSVKVRVKHTYPKWLKFLGFTEWEEDLAYCLITMRGYEWDMGCPLDKKESQQLLHFIQEAGYGI